MLMMIISIGCSRHCFPKTGMYSSLSVYHVIFSDCLKNSRGDEYLYVRGIISTDRGNWALYHNEQDHKDMNKHIAIWIDAKEHRKDIYEAMREFNGMAVVVGGNYVPHKRGDNSRFDGTLVVDYISDKY